MAQSPATVSVPLPLPTPAPTPTPLVAAEPISTVQTVVETIPEPEPEPEPKPEIQTDDEWGDMAGDWNETDDTLTSTAATFAQIQHENRRADGPRDIAGQTLRPLPGTTAGDDGWYFDREGRPSNWSHSEETGWTQE